MENRKLNRRKEVLTDFGPKEEKMAHHPAHRTKIRAAKAWADILSARLGLIQPNACEPFI
jgi:hypothetical protein